MPTYEYACTRCGQHVEVVQSMSDAPLTECGVCGGPLRKVFAPIGIVFKGSGFYRTDSRGKSPKSDSAPAAKDGSTKPAASVSSSESSGTSSSGTSSSGTSSSGTSSSGTSSSGTSSKASEKSA